MKKMFSQSVFLFVLLLLMVVSVNNAADEVQYNIITSSSKSIQLNHWQIAKDPSPKTILQNPADSLWQPLSPSSNVDKYAEGNWLIKTEIVIKDSVSEETVFGLFPINFITAYEIYWDGRMITKNGIIGVDKETEKAGDYNFYLPLSSQLLSKGTHTVILRISNFHNISSWKWFYGTLIIGPYDAILKNIYRLNYQAFFIIGILFIPFLFNLFLFFARKRRTEHLLFSIICFIVILDSITGLAPNLITTSTLYIHWQNYVYQIFTFLFALLFPAFFIYMFSFPKKYIGYIIGMNLIIFIFFTNIFIFFSVMSLTVLILSSIIVIWALFKRREGSLTIFVGLVAAWIAYFFNFAFAGLATVMVICTTFSIARQFAIKEKSEKEAQLKSAHLENELLKKNINPHFLLNTLTSIIAWLRKDPKSAIKLIEALAEEFRMVTQISPLKQIPIRQEIDLCNSHLKIMGFRKGAEYKLETVDIVEEETVPPMIFHTLIENGLKHGYENKTEGTFILQRKKNSNSIQYIFSDDGDFSSDEPKGSTGFGFRYIKSRLEESYPGRWEFISQRKVDGWETIINIKDN